MAENLCPACHQPVPEQPVPEQPVPEKPAVCASAAESEPQFNEAFAYLASRLPLSVRDKVIKKLIRCDIDPMSDSPEIEDVLGAAIVSYDKKRERARLSSAKRRTNLKIAKAEATPASTVQNIPL